MGKPIPIRPYSEVEKDWDLLVQVFIDEGTKYKNGTLVDEESRMRIGPGPSGNALYIRREDGTEAAFTQDTFAELELMHLANRLQKGQSHE